MKDHDIKVFPKYIDRPRLVGVFEIDEFFIGFGTVFLFILASMAFRDLNASVVIVLAMVTGVALALFYKKFKENRPDGYTLQKLYRLGVFSPQDDKKGLLKYKYLKRLKKVIPYGFTRVLYN